ncbi:MAG: hypothetical protein KYX64_11675 [Sphingopyxis sp.]|nr:hypothetical protein [Sphingopyxis sp.]
MRSTIIAALLLMPAAAQAQFMPIMPPTPPAGDPMPGISDMGTQPGGSTYRYDIREARDRISRGRHNGELSKSEARGLKREAGQIAALAERYGRDGLSDSERRELDMRTQVLKDLTAAQRLFNTP